MAADSLAWHKYVYEGKGEWWWCETNDDWFLEDSPGPWTQFLDPTSMMQYWWRDDTNWFWINGRHGQLGYSLTANTAEDKTSEKPILESSAEPQPLKTVEVAELQSSTPWASAPVESLPPRPTRQICGVGTQQPPWAPGKVLAPPFSVPHASAIAPLPPLPSSPVSLPPPPPQIPKSAPDRVPRDYLLCDEEKQSYVRHLPDCLSSKDAKTCLITIMDGMDDLGWDRPAADKRGGSCGGGGANRGVVGRNSKWLVSEGCSCTYQHSIVNCRPSKATPFPSWMDKIMQVCMPACGLTDPSTWPNCCIINRYSDGGEAIDWHCDDEALFGGLSASGERIITMALGSERRYEMRPADSPMYQEVPLSCSLLLKAGDILLMEGQFPQHYMHRVPKYTGKKNERVSLHLGLTFRWIVKHESTRCWARR